MVGCGITIPEGTNAGYYKPGNYSIYGDWYNIAHYRLYHFKYISRNWILKDATTTYRCGIQDNHSYTPYCLNCLQKEGILW